MASTEDAAPLAVTGPAGASQALNEIFVCSLCLELLCDPITTVCGHTFCRHCLARSTSQGAKKCPNCRAVCVIDARTHASSSTLVAALEALFPAEYQQRVADARSEHEAFEASHLAVFMMGQIAFPGTVLRLHLFEERYKLMIRRAVESTRRFLYVPRISRAPLRTGDLGLEVQINECELLPDGRAMLEGLCVRRVTIRDPWVEEGTGNLHYAFFEPLDDTPDAEPQPPAEPAEHAEPEPGDDDAAAAIAPAFVTLPELMERLRGCVEQFLARLDDGQRFALTAEIGAPPASDALFSFWVAHLVCTSQEERFAVLAARTVRERAELAMASIAAQAQERQCILQ